MAAHSLTVPPLARVEAGTMRAMTDDARSRAALERAWGGVRVVQVRAEPEEIPDGVLLNHLVVLNLGDEVSCEARFEGERWRAHRLPRHAWSLFPAGMGHAVRHAQSDVLFVELGATFAEEVLRPLGGGARLPPTLAAEDAFTRHVLLALAEQARGAAPLDGLQAEALGAVLVSRLASHAPPPQAAAIAAGLPSPKLRRVLDYVASHLDGPLTLRRLAELADMDLFRFVRAFKQSTGVSPHRYVLESRIVHAKELLRDRALSITEVAFRTGFATPSHFSVTFRRMTQTTPRGYREHLADRGAPRASGEEGEP